jgi:hypothetical protein
MPAAKNMLPPCARILCDGLSRPFARPEHLLYLLVFVK